MGKEGAPQGPFSFIGDSLGREAQAVPDALKREIDFMKEAFKRFGSGKSQKPQG